MDGSLWSPHVEEYKANFKVDYKHNHTWLLTKIKWPLSFCFIFCLMTIVILAFALNYDLQINNLHSIYRIGQCRSMIEPWVVQPTEMSQPASVFTAQSMVVGVSSSPSSPSSGIYKHRHSDPTLDPLNQIWILTRFPNNLNVY